MVGDSVTVGAAVAVGSGVAGSLTVAAGRRVDWPNAGVSGNTGNLVDCPKMGESGDNRFPSGGKGAGSEGSPLMQATGRDIRTRTVMGMRIRIIESGRQVKDKNSMV